VFQEVEAPRFQDNRHIKAVRLSAVRTDRLYPVGKIPGTHFCWRVNQPQGHRAAARVIYIKNCNDFFKNGIRDLPACNAVPQSNAPPPAPVVFVCYFVIRSGQNVDNLCIDIITPKIFSLLIVV